ncbi:MAG: hypothetical protein LUH18_09475 [Oscillospiraceae bacterium]|nr:hypothetical protein [Oscillospiraceae bacterium]
MPKHCGTWDSTKEYEVLSVVLYADTGDSYMSRKAVPIGVDISNTEYWSKSADFSAQVNRLQKSVDDAAETAEVLKAQIAENVSASTDADADYAAELVDARVDADGNTYTSLGERLRDHERSFLCKKMEGLFIRMTNGVRETTHENYTGNCTGNIVYDSSCGDIILENRYLVTGNDRVATIAFYDIDGNFLQGFNEESDFVMTDSEATFPSVNIPDGTVYFGVSLTSKAKSIWIRFSDGGILEEISGFVDAARETTKKEVAELEENAFQQAFMEVVSRVDVSCSKNLFNYNSKCVIPLHYLTESGGMKSHDSYNVGGYIPVTPGKSYYFTASSGGAYCCIYDAFFRVIGTFKGKEEVEIPEDGCYVRLSCPVSGTTAMFVKSANGTTNYEAFCPPYDLYQTVNANHLSLSNAVEEKLDKIKGKNLFNKENVTKETYLTGSGDAFPNTAYFITDFIPVEEGQTYYLNGFTVGGAYHCVFASDMSTVVKAFKDLTITIPEGGAFLRLSGWLSNLDVCQVEVGDSFTGYEAYTEYLPLLENTERIEQLEEDMLEVKGEIIHAYLPSDIYVAVGRTIELYNSQVCLEAEKYHVRWNCEIGKAMKRKFSVTGTESLIGEYTLSCEIVNDLLNVIWTAEATIHIVESSLAEKHFILPIGDSLTNQKAWEPEVRNLSGGNVQFVGTRGGYTANDSDGNSWTCCHEGRSGASASWYTKDSTYDYEMRYVGNPEVDTTANPFYDPSEERFSLAYYLEMQGSYLEATPTEIMLYLGTNGISLDNTSNAGAIKTIVDCIRMDDADIPIYMVNTLFRGNQNGIGTQQSSDGYASQAGKYKYEEDCKIVDLEQKLYSLLSEYENVYFIPIAVTHDSEYNFGNVETKVNPRAVQTEYLPVESVHPQAQGYYQMADCIWSVFAGTLE